MKIIDKDPTESNSVLIKIMVWQWFENGELYPKGQVSTTCTNSVLRNDGTAQLFSLFSKLI